MIDERGIAPTMYQPGDEVVIRNDLNMLDKYYMQSGSKEVYDFVMPTMMALAGKVSRVSYVEEFFDGMYKYCLIDDPCKCYWTDEMFVTIVPDEDDDLACADIDLSKFLKGMIKWKMEPII